MRRNSAGLWEEVANNVPRLQYPVGGGCPSWLFEPQATNIFLSSQVDDNINWFSVNISKVFNSIQSPRSGFLATKLVEDTSNDVHIMLAINTGGSNATHTISFYAKTNGRNIGVVNNGGGTSLICNFDLTAGTGSGLGFVSITDAGNGWWLCTCQYNPSISTYNIQLRLLDGTTASYLGDGVSGAYIWNTQYELGSVATSPIITAGSAVTRLADNPTTKSILLGVDEGAFCFQLKQAPTSTFGQPDYNGISENSAINGSGKNILCYDNGIYHNLGGGFNFLTTLANNDKICIFWNSATLWVSKNGATAATFNKTGITFNPLFWNMCRAGANIVNTILYDDAIFYTACLSVTEANNLTA
jgi:hypothetical protein